MVVPKGFDGLVMSTPLTLMFMASALLYAASKAWGVTWKLFELSQWIGTIFTLVLHRKSLSNLKKKITIFISSKTQTER